MTDRPLVEAKYDDGADALGITLATGPAIRQQHLGQNVRVTWGPKGELQFIEILFASDWYPLERLRAQASPAVELTLRQASKRYGLSVSTLKDQIKNRQLEARKRGRDWITTAAAMETYLINRHPAGRPALKGRARRQKVPPIAKVS